MITCKKLLLLLCLSIDLVSCKKFVDIPPPSQQVISDVVFANDATAISAVVGMYSEMMKASAQFSACNTTLYGGLYADELQYYSPGSLDPFINSNLTEAQHGLLSTSFWAPAYKYIYTANVCIEKLQASQGVTPAVKNMLVGESKFVRAFCLLSLVSFFGDVPLTLTSDYRVNASLARSAAATVYGQVISDLSDAKSLLPASYSGADRSRPNKWAAAALLARTYLYTSQWAKAEAEATDVLGSGTYFLNPILTNVFLKSSGETIWQLQPVNPVWNTWEGREILPPTPTATPTYTIRTEVLNAFEAGDNRKTAWVSSRTYLSQAIFFPSKYKVYGNNAPVTEYYVVLRLAEQYLIRSEARAHQNNVAGAQSDLNTIRARAGLTNTFAADQNSLLTAIESERRVELFCEWAHRWFDLKRTGKVDAVLAALKPTTWQSSHVLWPIPINEIHANPALTQNPGY